eukprot:11230967-Alexandrium_andersonii.AAC.1
MISRVSIARAESEWLRTHRGRSSRRGVQSPAHPAVLWEARRFCSPAGRYRAAETPRTPAGFR